GVPPWVVPSAPVVGARAVAGALPDRNDDEDQDEEDRNEAGQDRRRGRGGRAGRRLILAPRGGDDRVDGGVDASSVVPLPEAGGHDVANDLVRDGVGQSA